MKKEQLELWLDRKRKKKARKVDESKLKIKEEADKREALAQQARAINRKKYMERKKMIKLQQQQQMQEDEEGEVSLRDGRTRVVNIEMISQEKFAVTTNFVTPEEIINILKRFGAAYDKRRKEWEFKVPFSDTSKINIVDYDYHEDFEHKVLLLNLPKNLQVSLYNFQKVGVQFGIDHHGRCLIGDEMGVGKTIQAISISYLYMKDWPILIITPSSLRFTWRDELMNWLKFIKEEDIQVITSSQDSFSASCQVYIISYNIATRLAGLIDRKKFGICIVDEAHYLKSRDSKRARSLVPVLMKIKRILLLSGTPILARPNEIYNLMRVLRPDIFYSFKEFGLRFCNPKESYFGIDWTGSANNRELHQTLENTIMIRRLKSEVLTELPAKRRQRISISTDSNQVKKIHYMLKKVKSWQDKIGRRGENAFGDITNDFDEFVRDHGDNMMSDPTFSSLDDKYSYLVNAYGLTGTAKIKGIQEFMETLLENRCKFLIFAHHYDVLDAIEDTVIKRKVSHIRIDGKIDVTKRYEAVRKFQTDAECLVAVLSLTASCTGITLTAASTVVFAEMNWTPGIMVQAEDRAHRIGQIQSVNVYYLFGENTLDAMIYPRLKLKSEVFANVVDGKGTDFRIDNEDEAREQINKQIQEKKNNTKSIQKFEKISNQVAEASNFDMQQTNISDFFFVKNKVSSKVKNPNPGESVQNEDSIINCEGEDKSFSLNIQNGPDHIMKMINGSETRHQSSCNEVENFSSDDSDCEIREQMNAYDKYNEKGYNSDDFYLPEPPLASVSWSESTQKINIQDENWDEGTDTKQKAYQKLRADKNKMFEENKIFKKFTSQFKGLKRIHQRAKKPNKITEYELP
ncbi:snf2 family n-terminal domain containing protein [Stylonychia lemnae]|uniref:Snf2 family n-terminal domain containing protein n=1 Tax=Stylonychia lemnae TaxID=5949 RepID=A0A077ZS69_STYLE|nr:snf2 family n-terminal domain containing protein [Stylonychia lemnae]|eukprot:CDW72220.1 snf2 family n-terminal domain containing protein [Stylonychia lemnae]